MAHGQATEKSARSSCRIWPLVEEHAEAAPILGQSITDFAESALEEKPTAVLSENERIMFSAAAFLEFMTSITGVPDKPSENLVAAIATYHKHKPVVEDTHGRQARCGF